MATAQNPQFSFRLMAMMIRCGSWSCQVFCRAKLETQLLIRSFKNFVTCCDGFRLSRTKAFHFSYKKNTQFYCLQANTYVIRETLPSKRYENFEAKSSTHSSLSGRCMIRIQDSDRKTVDCIRFLTCTNCKFHAQPDMANNMHGDWKARELSHFKEVTGGMEVYQKVINEYNAFYPMSRIMIISAFFMTSL